MAIDIAHNMELSNAAELGLVGVGLWVVIMLMGLVAPALGRAPPDVEPWRLALIAVAIAWFVRSDFTPLDYAFDNYIVWLSAGDRRGWPRARHGEGPEADPRCSAVAAPHPTHRTGGDDMSYQDQTARLPAQEGHARRGPGRAQHPRWPILGAELLVVAVIVTVVIVISVGSGPSTSHLKRPQRPFAADSVWNAPVPANVPLAPQSSAYVQQLEHQAATSQPSIKTGSFSVPVYTVGRDQARVPVTLDQSDPGSVDELAKAFKAGVPIPLGARPAKGTDESMVVWQPSTNTLWEFWRMQSVDGKWQAKWGGKISDVSHSPGYYTDPSDWGGAATSLSILGGLMRISELKAGHIDHALALAIPAAAFNKNSCTRPSATTAMTRALTRSPRGRAFACNPKLDIEALHLPSTTQMMAEGGPEVRHHRPRPSGAMSFYGEPVTSGDVNPYAGPHGLFDGLCTQ